MLGLDPGFAKFGWAVLHVFRDFEAVVDIGVFETQKTAAKQKVLACEDNFARSREISRFLIQKVRGHSPVAVCFEAWSAPRNAANAAKVAFAYGVLASIMDRDNLPGVSPTPQRVKKRLTGRITATKVEVESAVEAHLCPEAHPALGMNVRTFTDYRERVPKTKREHGFDAVGVALASLDSEVIRTARQLHLNR